MMMMLMMMMVLGGGALYFMMKKKKDEGVTAPLTEFDVSGTPGGPVQIVPRGVSYVPEPFDLESTVFIPTEYNKPMVPITGGSTRKGGVERFNPAALGTCQCDSMKCCYKSIYQPYTGPRETYKSCQDVYWGDPTDACQRALDKFTAQTALAVTSRKSQRAIARGAAARFARMLR